MSENKQKLFIDLETRSLLKPSDKGAVSYAQDPSTEIVSIQWAVEDGEVFYFSPLQPVEAELKRFVRYFSTDADYTFVSHNVVFDWCVYTAKRDWLEEIVQAPLKKFKVSDTECTLYACAALNLPTGLGEAGEYLLGIGKEDNKNMLRFAAANKKTGKFEPLEGAAYEQFREYALQDVHVLRELYKKVKIPQEWLDEFHTSLRMNIKGVNVDTKLVDMVWRIIPDMDVKTNKEIEQVTGGVADKATQSKRLLEWANKQHRLYIESLGGSTEGHPKRYTTLNEKECKNLLLQDDTSPKVKELIDVIINKPTVSKWKSIKKYLSQHNTLSGCFNPRGALSGRWSSKGLNLQNLPARGGSKEFDLVEMADNVVSIGVDRTVEKMGITKRDIVKLGVRPALKAREGYTFIIRDFSQMEDRIACLLCGNSEGLEAHRRGDDPYIALARNTLFNKQDISSRERYIAKQAKLALSYGMGADTFKKYCNMGGVDVTCQDLGIEPGVNPYQWVVDKYRGYFSSLFVGDNAWEQMDTLLKDAIINGQEGSYLDGRIYTELLYDGVKVKRLQICSTWGLRVSYWEPDWFTYIDKWGRECIGYKGKTADTSENNPKFTYKDLYGGKVFNNLCQGTAHILLASVLVRSDALLREKKWGQPIITVHDEVIWEVKKEVVEEADNELKAIMESFTGPLSAIPVVSTCEVHGRYTK